MVLGVTVIAPGSTLTIESSDLLVAALKIKPDMIDMFSYFFLCFLFISLRLCSVLIAIILSSLSLPYHQIDRLHRKVTDEVCRLHWQPREAWPPRPDKLCAPRVCSWVTNSSNCATCHDVHYELLVLYHTWYLVLKYRTV